MARNWNRCGPASIFGERGKMRKSEIAALMVTVQCPRCDGKVQVDGLGMIECPECGLHGMATVIWEAVDE